MVQRDDNGEDTGKGWRGRDTLRKEEKKRSRVVSFFFVIWVSFRKGPDAMHLEDGRKWKSKKKYI